MRVICSLCKREIKKGSKDTRISTCHNEGQGFLCIATTQEFYRKRPI